jgi:hypothetical protein
LRVWNEPKPRSLVCMGFASWQLNSGKSEVRRLYMAVT